MFDPYIKFDVIIAYDVMCSNNSHDLIEHSKLLTNTTF